MIKKIHLLSIVLFLLVTSCSDISGTISEVDYEVSGVLVTGDGAPASSAVYLISAGEKGLYKDTIQKIWTNPVDGSYLFRDVSHTISSFRLYSQKDSLVVARDTVRNTDTLIEMGVDTLRLPGAITGKVEKVDALSPLGITVFIPGLSSAICLADDRGNYEITNLPPHRSYTVCFKEDGYRIDSLPLVYVTENDTITLETMTLQKSGIPPKPTLQYDPLKNIVTLSWDGMDDPLPDGYIVYRKDSTLTAQEPAQLNKDYLISEAPFTYVDTLRQDLFSQGDTITLEYTLKGAIGDERTNFSEPVRVTAATLEDKTTGGTFTSLSVTNNTLTLITGNSEMLTWQSTGVIDSVSLWISDDSMNTWKPLAEAIANSNAYRFSVPPKNTDHCFFKITDADPIHKTVELITSVPYVIASSLLKNSNFSAGGLYWNQLVMKNKGASARFDCTGSCKVTIDAISTDSSDVKISQTEVPLAFGKTYHLSFKALVTETKKITFEASTTWDQATGAIVWKKEDILITPDTLSYVVTIDVTQESEKLSNILFYIGASLDDIEFDDIVLEVKE